MLSITTVQQGETAMGENREYLTQSASDGSINISEDVVVAP